MHCGESRSFLSGSESLLWNLSDPRRSPSTCLSTSSSQRNRIDVGEKRKIMWISTPTFPIGIQVERSIYCREWLYLFHEWSWVRAWLPLLKPASSLLVLLSDVRTFVCPILLMTCTPSVRLTITSSPWWNIHIIRRWWKPRASSTKLNIEVANRSDDQHLIGSLLLEIYRYIGNTHITFSTDFDKVIDHNRDCSMYPIPQLFRKRVEMLAKISLSIVNSMKMSEVSLPVIWSSKYTVQSTERSFFFNMLISGRRIDLWWPRKRSNIEHVVLHEGKTEDSHADL